MEQEKPIDERTMVEMDKLSINSRTGFAWSGAMALMLWSIRRQFPDMSVPITLNDVEEFSKCIDYLNVQPAVRALVPVVHSTGKLGNTMYVQLIDEKTGGGIRPDIRTSSPTGVPSG